MQYQKGFYVVDHSAQLACFRLDVSQFLHARQYHLVASAVERIWATEGSTAAIYIISPWIGNALDAAWKLETNPMMLNELMRVYYALCERGWRPEPWHPDIAWWAWRNYRATRAQALAVLACDGKQFGGHAIMTHVAKWVWADRHRNALQCDVRPTDRSDLKRSKFE